MILHTNTRKSNLEGNSYVYTHIRSNARPLKHAQTVMIVVMVVKVDISTKKKESEKARAEKKRKEKEISNYLFFFYI